MRGIGLAVMWWATTGLANWWSSDTIEESQAMPRDGRTARQRSRNDNGSELRNIRDATINASTMDDNFEEMVDLMKEGKNEIMGVCETRLFGDGPKIIHTSM